MENPLTALIEIQSSLPKQELRAAIFITNHPQTTSTSTIAVLAKQAATSVPSIQRLIKRIGYKGFSDFKFVLTSWLQTNHDQQVEPTEDLASTVVDNYVRYIRMIKQNHDDDSLNAFAQNLRQANHILIHGINRAGIVSRHLGEMMYKFGLQPLITNDKVVADDIATGLRRGDTFILYSNRGHKNMHEDILKVLARIDCHKVLVTANANSPMRPEFDATFVLPNIQDSSAGNAVDNMPIFMIFNEIVQQYLIKNQ